MPPNQGEKVAMPHTMRLFLAVCMVLLGTMSDETLAGSEQVLVPVGKEYDKGVAIVIETVSFIAAPTGSDDDGALKSVAAKKQLRVLRQVLEVSFRPARKNDYGQFSALCNIIVREWDEGEPNFLVKCFSEAMWKDDDPFYSPPTFLDKAEEVKSMIDGWERIHKTRLERKRPLNKPALKTPI